MAETPVLLVVGGNRGIGLGVVREALRRGWRVIATARQPDRAADLARLNVRIEQLDMAAPQQIDVLADRIGERLNAALINAGVAGPAHRSAMRATEQEAGALMFVN